MRCAKTFLFFLAAASACAAIAILPKRLVFESGESYTFFCGTSSSCCKTITVKSNAALCRLALKDVCGESTTYRSLDIQSFLKEVGGEIIFTEELADSVNYYCKANLPYAVELYGTAINLHICLRQEGVTVASPIIFGGY